MPMQVKDTKSGTDLLSGIKETMVLIQIGWKEKANNCQTIPIGLKVIFCFFQTSFKVSENLF